MCRRREHLGHGPLLHHSAVAHHRHAVGQSAHHRQVVADHDEAGATALHFRKQVEDLRLHGDIQRGGRLVGDEQRWIQRDRRRDQRTLALAAGELVRQLPGTQLWVGHPHGSEQLDHPSGTPGAVTEAVKP